MEENPKKIVVVGARTPELNDSLEVLIKYMSEYRNEQIINIPDLSAISPLNPAGTNLILYCSQDHSEEDINSLIKNHRIPVIGVLQENELEDVDALIEKYNYFSANPEPDVKNIPNLTNKFTEALKMKRSADRMLKSTHSEFLLDANLEKNLEQEVKATRNGEVKGDYLLYITRSPPRQISTFEALYILLSRQSQTRSINIDKDLHMRLISRVVPHLKLLEKKILNLEEAAVYRQNAKNELRPIIEVLSNKSKWKDYNVVQVRLGGSTVAEKGSRFLLGAVHRKKYTEKEAEDVYFMRDIYGRKGIKHETIAKIRYACSKLFTDDNGMGRCAALLPPIHYENMSWIIEQGLIGRGFDWVMTKLWERISNVKGKEKARYIRIKDALEKKYVNDLIAWQKNTRKIPSDFPEIQKTGEKIARAYRKNLSVLAKTYETYGVFTRKERLLWGRSIAALTKSNLGITKKKTALSRDASSRNARIYSLQNTFSLDGILIEITTDDEPDKEKINNHFYHIDTGFVLTHSLEDFFHIVDAYEVADTEAKPAEVIKTLDEKYQKFRKDNGFVEDYAELYLMGTYRNMRRAYLVLKEFHKKSKEDSIEGLISQTAYERERKDYINQHTHHISRSEIYLKELHKHFEARMKKNAGGFPELEKEYNCLTQMLRKECLSEKVIESYVAWFNKLQKSIDTDRHSRRKKRYLCSMLYSSMTNAMTKLCNKLTEFNALPKYKDLPIGDTDA